MKHFVFSAVQRIWNGDSAVYNTAVSVSRLTARKNWITMKLYTGYLCFDRCKSCTKTTDADCLWSSQTTSFSLLPACVRFDVKKTQILWKSCNNGLCLNWLCSQFENRWSLRFSEPLPNRSVVAECAVYFTHFWTMTGTNSSIDILWLHRPQVKYSDYLISSQTSS